MARIGRQAAAEVTGNVNASMGFTPSAYDTDLTMEGTAQSVALATGVTRIRITNRGASTEAVRVAFGTSALDAESNLNIAGALATTGVFLPAVVSTTDQSGIVHILGVPALATHYAVANAVVDDTPIVSVEQGM